MLVTAMSQRESRSYVPHIDGLRAVAVLAVIVYHLNERWLPGGFSGVDIFFVISGFVVSASVGELKKESLFAFFSFFYARRMLRILPALIVCLMITHIAAMLFIPSAWLSQTNQQTGLYAFFGLSNFILAQTSNDYFSPRADFNPYTHTWSLGVEEQFYLVFPPLFAAWFAKDRWPIVSTALFCLGLAASIGIAVHWSHTNPSLDFYMLASRFWELAAGVLLYQALVHGRRSFSEHGRSATWISDGGAALSLGLIAVGLVVSAPARFPFPGALLPVAGTVGLLGFLQARDARSWVARALGNRVFVFIGKISYSLYLWHWPVFVLLRWTTGLESTGARVAAIVSTFALATLSYFFVERPVRYSAVLRSFPRPAVIASAMVFLVGSWWCASHINVLGPGYSLSTVVRNGDEWYPSDHLRDSKCPLKAQFKGAAIAYSWDRCTQPPAATAKLFVIGDSHAFAYLTMLTQFAADTGIELRMYNNGGCPFLSLQNLREGDETSCRHHGNPSVADILASARAGDILFLPSLRLDRLAGQYALGPPRPILANANTDPAGLRRRADEAVELLRPFSDKGMHIVFDAPKPIFRAPPFRCSDWFNAGNAVCSPGLTMQRSDLERYRRPVLDAFSSMMTRLPGMSVWDPFPVLCPADSCSAMQGEHPLFFDGDHISAFGDRMLLPSFESYMTRLAAADAAKRAP